MLTQMYMFILFTHKMFTKNKGDLSKNGLKVTFSKYLPLNWYFVDETCPWRKIQKLCEDMKKKTINLCKEDKRLKQDFMFFYLHFTVRHKGPTSEQMVDKTRKQLHRVDFPKNPDLQAGICLGVWRFRMHKYRSMEWLLSLPLPLPYCRTW